MVYEIEKNLIAQSHVSLSNHADVSRVEILNELMRLKSQLSAPKLTEHFISDIHGESEKFVQVLNQGSDVIEKAIDSVFFSGLSSDEKKQLLDFIVSAEKSKNNSNSLLAPCSKNTETCFFRLLKLCRYFRPYYSQKTVAEYFPSDLSKIFQEFLASNENANTRFQKRKEQCRSIMSCAEDLFNATVLLASFIRQIAAPKLHVIGDIYDRGPGAEKVMDALMSYPDVDIQWGNHDIIWMGAAGGSAACIANVIRICLRYGNTQTLEQGYNIDLSLLETFSKHYYGNEVADIFSPKPDDDDILSVYDRASLLRMHKAISIIQFKLEGQIIKRRPHYKMTDRLLLDKIEVNKGTIVIEGKEHALLDHHFPTLNEQAPYALSEQEHTLVEQLIQQFTSSPALQRHVDFLFSHGAMYLVHNHHLLFHACTIMEEDGSFGEFEVNKKKYSGKALFDKMELVVRQGCFLSNNIPEETNDNSAQDKQYGLDLIWYLWNGAQSPLFGKQKMATFERYFLADKETHREGKNAYYDFRNDKDMMQKVLQEFNVDIEKGRIVNGHVPVKVKKGEQPIKAEGKLVVIDGGFSQAYQNITGIAGYLLISNANSIFLKAEVVDIESSVATHSIETLEIHKTSLTISHTDEGVLISSEIARLTEKMSDL